MHPYYALSQDPQSHPLSETHQQETGVDIQTGEESPNDPKRPRACEACRGLKVRCEPGTSNPEGACRRCAKAGRQCVITLPSRKRQKKTDSRVAELEKKIDALHASIQATKHSTIIEPQRRWEGNSHGGDELPHTTPDKGSSLSSSSQALQHDSVRANDRRGQTEAQYPIVQSQSQEIASHGLTVPSAIAAGRKRRHSEDNQDLAGNLLAPASMSGPTTKSANDRTKSYPSNIHDFLIPNETRASKRPSVVSAGSSSSQLNLPAHEYADIIDRKILDAGTATQIFDHYIRDMAFHLPAVVFPQGTTAAEIRRTKPTLFLAILSVSSGLSHPEIQRVLTKELTRVYADRIIIKGEKTLELIQALQISALWYWPPEHYEELKFYQLIHIGVVMAIDVGLGKRSKPSTHGNLGLWRDHPWKKTPFPNPNSVESRRAWLGCYFLCAK